MHRRRSRRSQKVFKKKKSLWSHTPGQTMQKPRTYTKKNAEFIFSIYILEKFSFAMKSHEVPSSVSQVSSQTSSVSSGDDYIIVLPDCFDTSRPLGESMYSSAMSQPDAIAAPTVTSTEKACEGCDFEPFREAAQAARSEDMEESPGTSPTHSSVNQMLCASQTLDTVTLTPEVVPLPGSPQALQPLPALYSPRLQLSQLFALSFSRVCPQPTRGFQPGFCLCVSDLRHCIWLRILFPQRANHVTNHKSTSSVSFPIQNRYRRLCKHVRFRNS